MKILFCGLNLWLTLYNNILEKHTNKRMWYYWFCFMYYIAYSKKAKGTLQVPSVSERAYDISDHSWEEQLYQCTGAKCGECAAVKQVQSCGTVWRRRGGLLPTRGGDAIRSSSALYFQVPPLGIGLCMCTWPNYHCFLFVCLFLVLQEKWRRCFPTAQHTRCRNITPENSVWGCSNSCTELWTLLQHVLQGWSACGTYIIILSYTSQLT